MIRELPQVWRLPRDIQKRHKAIHPAVYSAHDDQREGLPWVVNFFLCRMDPVINDLVVHDLIPRRERPGYWKQS